MEMDEKIDAVDFLAHHGVKGQKWGVRRSTSVSSGSVVTKAKAALGDPKVRSEAITAGKAAFTVTKYGLVPLAAATGIGIPAVAGLGISMRVISDPGVRAAVTSAGKYTNTVLKNAGVYKMSDVAKKLPHKSPFSVATTTKDSSFSGKPKKLGPQLRAYGPNANITLDALNKIAMPGGSGRSSGK